MIPTLLGFLPTIFRRLVWAAQEDQALAVPWKKTQIVRVDNALAENPKHSGRCAVAARTIVPVARETDPTARGRVLRPIPGEGVLVVPVDPHPEGARWRHHVATDTQRHVVDGFTGPTGDEESGYLAKHWQYHDALHWCDEDIDGGDL